MDIFFGRHPLISQLVSMPQDYEKGLHPVSRTYLRDTKAIFNTSVDVKELPNSYVYTADMPGLKSGDIKVEMENDNVLSIGGERKPEAPSDEAKYLRLERPSGKFLRKFTLPGNAKLDGISASCADGVLTVTVPKIPPPEPQKPKSIVVSGE